MPAKRQNKNSKKLITKPIEEVNEENFITKENQKDNPKQNELSNKLILKIPKNETNADMDNITVQKKGLGNSEQPIENLMQVVDKIEEYDAILMSELKKNLQIYFKISQKK